MEKWVRINVNKWELQGTSLIIRKEVVNSATTYNLYSFNTVVAIADKLAEIKKIAKTL